MVMTNRALSLFAVFFFVFSSSVFCQDPTKVAPDAYKLQFENEWVKVTSVHYGARTKIPVHDHSRWPAAYVYLNDAGPIIFSHTGWEHPVLTRPSVKARSFRLSPTMAVAETHQVENPGNTASDLLRIEFRTTAPTRSSLRGRFPALKYPAGRNFSKNQFENEQIRVRRLACAAGKKLAVTADPTTPVMLVVLSATRIATPEGKTAAYQPGDTIWIEKAESKILENLAASPFELLRFDFKTAPEKSGK
jgi:beta-alanine degradation protein BauB